MQKAYFFVSSFKSSPIEPAAELKIGPVLQRTLRASTIPLVENVSQCCGQCSSSGPICRVVGLLSDQFRCTEMDSKPARLEK